MLKNSLLTETHCIELQTNRLLLRNVQSEDADEIFKYANNLKIAEMMNGSIPHPYQKETAIQWIIKHQNDSIHTPSISWAITKIQDNKLIGSIQLRINKNEASAYLSYWLAEPFWNNGYMTEAAKKIIDFCYKKMKIRKFISECYARNEASSSVLKKLGFTYHKTIKKIEKLNDSEELFDEYILTMDM